MVSARRGEPRPGPDTSFAPPPSDTGMELEAALPDVPQRPAHEAPILSLDEPSGEFASPVAGALPTVRANRPHDDLEIIRAAWAFCVHQHEGQLRASGEPYIIHPLEVAQVLAELKMDSTAIAAGLLHDAVEDTDVTSPEIAKRFGDQVAHIVEGVTKLEKIKFANREEHQAENIGKMLT